MIELIAYEQRPTLSTDMVGKQWTLDITQPGSVSLNYEVSKGDDVMGRYSPFSQTFRLPFTNYNSRFFALYYDVNLSPSNATGTGFSIHRKTVCEIRSDGIPIIQGTLQLKNVHTKSEEYEVVVFGEEATVVARTGRRRERRGDVRFGGRGLLRSAGARRACENDPFTANQSQRGRD